MTSTLMIIAAILVVELVVSAIGKLLETWGQVPLPETSQAKMSDTDKRKIEETKEIIQQCFGVDVVEQIRKSSNRERIDLMADFANRLALDYGLDIDVDVTVKNVNNGGSYDWKAKRAEFNIALLMVEADNEYFEYCVRETISAIVHELRHAVQHRAIEDKGFWDIDEKRRKEWAKNMLPGNYIRGDVDLKAYALQPIEKDAFTFSEMVMKGVM